MFYSNVFQIARHNNYRFKKSILDHKYETASNSARRSHLKEIPRSIRNIYLLRSYGIALDEAGLKMTKVDYVEKCKF
jgi:hypothetical protein